jgi:chromosome segregation ATPase
MKQRWENEKRQLLGEKAVLQDAANRMNMEVRSAKDEANRAAEASRRPRADTREIEKAKAVIADLEADLQAERTRLRQMSTEQNRVQREKSGITRQLQRTEAVCPITNSKSASNLKIIRISMMSRNSCRESSVKIMN